MTVQSLDLQCFVRVNAGEEGNSPGVIQIAERKSYLIGKLMMTQEEGREYFQKMHRPTKWKADAH